jgi:hypothetical protein
MRNAREPMTPQEAFVRISTGLSRRLAMLEARSAGAPMGEVRRNDRRYSPVPH